MKIKTMILVPLTFSPSPYDGSIEQLCRNVLELEQKKIPIYDDKGHRGSLKSQSNVTSIVTTSTSNQISISS